MEVTSFGITSFSTDSRVNKQQNNNNKSVLWQVRLKRFDCKKHFKTMSKLRFNVDVWPGFIKRFSYLPKIGVNPLKGKVENNTTVKQIRVK